MKTLTARNQNLTLEENIHAALKREFMYAKPLIKGELYEIGNNNDTIEITWAKNDNCEYTINTNEGCCYIMYTTKFSQ